jgi:hypothetical protein
LYIAADEVESICRLLVLGDEEEVVGGGGDDARLKKPFREERVQSQCWSWGWKCFRAGGKLSSSMMESSTQEVLEQQEDPVHSSFASPLEVCKNFLLFLPWFGRTTMHHQGSVVPLLWVRDEVFAEIRLMGIVEV